MALSGTITGKADNTNYTLTCEWSATQSTANNTSTITAKVYLKAPSGWSTISSYWSCVINGTTVTSSKSATVSSTKVLLGTKTWTASHNSDGTLSTTISFSYSNGLTSAGTYTTKSGSGSGTATLNTIARGSSFSLSTTSVNMGSEVKATITRASSSFTHTINYVFGGTTTTVVTKGTATSYSFTPPVSLASNIPNATSGTATVHLYTYSGSTQVGHTTKTLTLKVPSSVKPTVGISVTANNALSGHDVATKTTFTVKAASAAGSYGSKIKSYLISGGGLNSTSSSATSGTQSAGSVTFTVKVTDSRGRTASASTTRTIREYTPPTCSITATTRCDSAGTANNNGTYMKVTFKYNITNIASANVNAKKYTLYKKLSTASSWTTVSSGTLNNYSGSMTVSCGSGFATTSSYNFKVTIKDSYTSSDASSTASTMSCIMNLESGGVGIGKIWEKGKLDVGGAIYANGTLQGVASVTLTGDKNAVVGVGGSDVYLSNSKSGKYLQLKDNGTLCYSDNAIYHAGNKYVGTLNLTTANTNARIGYSSADACTFIANGSNNWLRLKDDGGITWKGYDLVHSNGTHSISGGLNLGSFSNSFFCTTYKRKTDAEGNLMTKIGASTAGGEPAMAIEVGTHDGSSTFTLKSRYRFAVSAFTPATTNVINLGSSGAKWKVVYAGTGSINTSDERYKVDLTKVDTQECWDLIKNTPVYNYLMIDKDKNTLTKDEIDRIIDESDDVEYNPDKQMGILAQDIVKYNCGKYVAVHDKWIDENTKEEKEQYGINPYSLASVTMAALQQEIKLREEENAELRKIIMELTERLEKLENIEE